LENILIVDDEENMRFILSELLETAGYKTYQAESGTQALELFRQIKPQLVLLDYKLPDINGMKVLEKIQKLDSSIIVIMITAYGDIKNAVTSMKLGAYDYLTKPFNNVDILHLVKKALNTSFLKKKVKSYHEQISKDTKLQEMMGQSAEIKKVLSQVELVAESDITVFLEGETGTGKDLIARMIHERSPRKNRPFIAVDCGAIPDTLFESEMFGHEKGAFTGANTTVIGKFERANGGTLFLDEICNLPTNMQSKLLRVIQNKEIMRLGGKSTIKVDIRLIAACNNNIVEEIKISNFRKDLFYRINEFNIILPSLKERKKDIPVISRFFIKEMNPELNKNVQDFDESAMQKLINYEWPGNIRELKNVIKRAILFTKTNRIYPEHLIFRDIQKEVNSESQDILKNNDFLIEKATNEAKKNIIKDALQKTKGNKTKAAKILGISRRQLYWELNRLGIEK